MLNIAGQTRDLLLASDPDPLKIPKSRKRKHSDLNHAFRIGETSTIQADPSIFFPRAQHLIPRFLLPRSCLPLSYLDPKYGSEDNLGADLFSARIELLEQDVRDDPQSLESKVLIAQSAVDGQLHCIERAQSEVYAMCKLDQQVSLSAIEQAQSWSQNEDCQLKRHFLDPAISSGDIWWGAAASSANTSFRKPQNALPGSSRHQNFRVCLQNPLQQSTPSTLIPEDVSLPFIQDQMDNSVIEITEDKSQELEELFKMVKVQYQQALYASKTSLAYFAKGPLSRVRAALKASDSSMDNLSHLITFLKSCILPLATMDTKYKDTLPKLVKELPFETFSDDDYATAVDAVSKRTRKSKTTKIGKNGLYPGEEVNITRWWLGRDLSTAACDSAEAKENCTRSAVLEQRARETQMQLILILETLALESTATQPPVGTDTLSTRANWDDGFKKVKKPGKSQDLNMLSDLLVDRLCIWQSMSVDEAKASNNELRSASQSEAIMACEATDSNQLGQFCVDVVLPFYGARLPDVTTSLCQKLGGAQQPSPRRPTLARAASSNAPPTSGTSMQRPQRRKPRRTLERVLTEERSGSQKFPPSLSRSVTEPVLPHFKREVSDMTLSTIPLNRVAMHKRYSQREVDLRAASQSLEARLDKKTRVEEELQSAIAALKKPNARMAVKELVEDAERRAARPHSRKSKNPVRNPFTQSVQIMATPSNNRHKDVFPNLTRPRPNAAPLSDLSDVEAIPPSSISQPLSCTSKAPKPFTSIQDSAKKHNDGYLSVIEQTPTRGPSKLSGRPPTTSSTKGSTSFQF